jgi:hypothetical protein
MFRLFFCFFCGVLFGQTQQQKTWDATAIKSVTLDFAWSSSIKISTHKEPTIRVNYQKEGEYQNLYSLQKQLDGKSFYLEEVQHLDLDKAGDKLSAHKVVANSIEVLIPEGMLLTLLSKETQLYCSGVYENINVRIEHGTATFNIENPKGIIRSLSADLHFYGIPSEQLPSNLIVNTSRGNIVVHPN